MKPSEVAVPGPADQPDGSTIDAFLLVSFGGPEGPDEVMPFLERVTAGRNIPPERLRLVGKHYFDRGGVSPINDQCRTLVRELEAAFADHGVDLPIYWGNRNSPPFLDDTVATMHRDGVRHAAAFVTSAYSSYSGCRQYRENLGAALGVIPDGALSIEKLRVFFDHPGFIEPLVDGLAVELARRDRATTTVLFSAHSIPKASAETSAYESQILEAARLVADRLPDMPQWSVVWQSRSGPPSMPWLEPDICDAIAAIDSPTVTDVVVVPIGFVSDHMEVLQDLDTDAAAAAKAAGLSFGRVPTSGTDPRFVAMIVDLVRERTDGLAPRALGDLDILADQCSQTCCPAPTRAPRPSV